MSCYVEAGDGIQVRRATVLFTIASSLQALTTHFKAFTVASFVVAAVSLLSLSPGSASVCGC